MPRKKIVETKEESDHNSANHDIIEEINNQLTEADEYVAKRANKKTERSVVDSSEVPDVFTDEIISNHDDDQSMDEETAQKLDEEAKQSFLENDVFDAIVRFMKTDDLISEKEKELRDVISPLKKERTELENFLIDYLEKIDHEFIKIGEKTQLTKVERETKGPIKPENVADALVEGFKKHELYTEEQKEDMMRVIKDMMAIVEAKREKKIKKKITRVDLEKEAKKKAAKGKKGKKDAEDAENEENDAKLDAKVEKIEKQSKAKKATKGPVNAKANPKATTKKISKAAPKKVTKTRK